MPANPPVFVTFRTLILIGTGGYFLCFAICVLGIGAPGMFWQAAPQLMLFPWAVFAVAFWRLSQFDSSLAARPVDIAIVMLFAVAAIPLATSLAALGLGIGGLGAFALWRSTMSHSRGDTALKAAAVCLLALCANLFISPLIFRLGYGQFIGFDMALLQTAIDIAGAPVTVTPAGMVAEDGLRVLLVGACSSFAGVSAAVLVHMGWAMVVRTEVGWRDMIAVAATVCLATLINIIRLTLTASGHEAYAFWHGAVGQTPLGGQIFWFLQNAILLTGGYISATWASPHHGQRRAA